MTSEVKFEVQPLQEVWRFPGCTFNVSYPTHKTVSIIGMRGEDFTRNHYLGLNNVFYARGYRTIIFEREINGKLEFQERKLKPPFPHIKATTFMREQ